MTTNQIEGFWTKSICLVTQQTFLKNFHQNIRNEIAINANFHFSHYKSMEIVYDQVCTKRMRRTWGSNSRRLPCQAVMLPQPAFLVSWCFCYHDVLSRHINCHCQGIYCNCHDAPVVMMFYQGISLCHCQRIYCICHDAPVGMMFYWGIPLVTIKQSLVIVMMLLLSWFLIKTHHLTLSRNLL